MRARERTPIEVRIDLVPDGERLRSTTKNVFLQNLGSPSLSTLGYCLLCRLLIVSR